MPPAWEKLRRIAYSCFVVTNLVVIVYCNLPHSIGNSISVDLQLMQDHCYQQARWQGALVRETRIAVGWLDWQIRRYAHLSGLNNRWQMFGRQSRFNWWYVISARYSDGEQVVDVVLPLPRQSLQSEVPRTFWEYRFFDFREGKFHLNMYNEPYDRAAYCRYLAREFPEHEGLPIESVAIELYYRNIREPDEARATGSHLEPEIHHFTLNRFQARGEVEPVRGIYSLPPPKSHPSASHSPAEANRGQSDGRHQPATANHQ